MKRLLATGTACCVFLACAGGSAKVAAPDVEFVQLSGPADQNYTPGNIEVQYGLRIANRAAVPITLEQVQVQMVGVGGAYRLVNARYHFRREIQPQQSADVTFWAKAVAAADAFDSDVHAPITVRATAYFESPSGGFRKVVTKMFEQR